MPGSEGRAGMAAIVDKENSINLNKLTDGIKKALPSYARPMFLRILNEVEMTGKYFYCYIVHCKSFKRFNTIWALIIDSE